MPIPAIDVVASTLSTALDGLSLRQRVTADNISNIDTPGFTAATVDFESSLRSALADGSLAAGASVAPGARGGPPPPGPARPHPPPPTPPTTPRRARTATTSTCRPRP